MINKNAEEVKSNWENLRKERDFHRENYKKVKIANDIKLLHNDFTTKIANLNLKYVYIKINL